MTDAIGRTLFRLLVSRRNLLEWVTAAQAQLSSRLSLLGVYRHMSASVATAAFAILAVAVAGQGAWWIVLPFAALWTAAPAIARGISVSPLVAGRLPVSPSELQYLRLVARRTWRFFETFVTADDNMLPPDNFQEDPHPVVAHRTSPTNLGLYLLCTVSARDFGWTGTVETVQRLEATLATMQKMQRYRGHFYNWYDTRDLRPLDPRYVSSVDSGNLAAHLIAVANACREWVGARLTRAAAIAGIDDAIQLTREALLTLPDDRRAQSITRHQVEDALNALVGALEADASDLAAHAATLTDGAFALASEQADEAHSDMLFWAEAVQRSIESWRVDLAQTEASNHALDQRLLGLESTARAMALAMDFDFLLDPERKLLAIGYRATKACWTRAATTCSPPRRDWRASSRSRRTTFRLVTGFGWGGRSRRSARRGADLLVGIDVRVPDALAGHACACRESAGADQSPDRAPADRLWRSTRHALGHFRVRLQRPRPRADLSILELRRARSRSQTRLERERGDCALRYRPCSDDRSAGRDAQFRPTRRGGRTRSIWFLRSARLHTVASAGRRGGRDRASFHGAPSGDDHRGHRERALRWQDARAVSCRGQRARDGTVVAGAHAAGRFGRPSEGRRSQDRGAYR